jgi:hypothetical protein
MAVAVAAAAGVVEGELVHCQTNIVEHFRWNN